MKRISLTRKTALIVLIIMIISQFIYIYLNVNSFQKAYYTELRSSLEAVGKNVKTNLNYILHLGIAVDKLVGVESLLKGILSDVPELKYLAISDVSEIMLYYCDRSLFLKDTEKINLKTDELGLETPLEKAHLLFALAGKENIRQGTLIMAIDSRVVAKKIREIILDLGTVVVISLLVTLDFLFFIVAFTIAIPLKRASDDIRLIEENGLLDYPVTKTRIDFLDRVLNRFEMFRQRFRHTWVRLNDLANSLQESSRFQSDLLDNKNRAWNKIRSSLGQFRLTGDSFQVSGEEQSAEFIRPAVFLFVFAEALTISFLPLYARDLYRPLWNISEDVVLGLPIAAFMFFLGVSLPLGGAWSDRIGRKKTFLIGAVITASGLFLTGIAPDVLWLIGFRSLSAVGYGILFMTCQGYIVDVTTQKTRAGGMAIFIAAFYGGTLCGSAIGGILAERLGFRLLFHIGALFSLLSAIFVYAFITERSKTGNAEEAVTSSGKWLQLLSNRNFLALLFFQSIPSKVCLIGLVYYVSPLFLQDLGNNQSNIGRIVMGYSLVMILFSQSASKWADKKGNVRLFIFWGGTISGLALMPFYFYQNNLMIILAIVILGLAHALSISSQAKLATQLKVIKEVGVGGGFGVYRMLERIGNVVSPILIGILASTMGYGKSLAVIGVYTFVSSLLFLATCREGGKQSASGISS